MRILEIFLVIMFGITALSAIANEEQNKTLDDYPALKEFFPFGMYVAAERIGFATNPGDDEPKYYGRPMMESYSRSLRDMARHHINLIGVQNTAAIPLPILKKMLAEGERNEIYMWASENSLPALEEAEGWAKERLQPLRDEKGILVWSPWDEPLDTDLQKWLEYKKVFESADPNHPVVAMTHGGPKGFEHFSVVQGCDHYPVFADNPNPWAVGPFVRRYVDFTPIPIWFAVQAFQGEGRRMPTIPEMRLMTYMSLAEGAKGILYFIYDHLTNPINAPMPLWDDIGEMGRKLRAVGPEILDTRPVTNNGFLNFDVIPNSDPNRPKDLPSANYSILQSSQEYAFVVVYNTSVVEEAHIKLEISSEHERDLYDLRMLVNNNVDLAGQRKINLTLAPGSGCIFLMAKNPEEYIIISKRIRVRLYEMETLKLSIDLAIPLVWGVELGPAREIISQAKEAKQRDEWRIALQLISGASEALQKAESESLEYYNAKTAMNEAQTSITRHGMLVSEMRQRGQITQEQRWRLDGFFARFLEIRNDYEKGDRAVTLKFEELAEEAKTATKSLTM